MMFQDVNTVNDPRVNGVVIISELLSGPVAGINCVNVIVMI